MYKVGETIQVFDGDWEKIYLLVLYVNLDYCQIQVLIKTGHKKKFEYKNKLFLKCSDIKELKIDIRR